MGWDERSGLLELSWACSVSSRRQAAAMEKWSRVLRQLPQFQRGCLCSVLPILRSSGSLFCELLNAVLFPIISLTSQISSSQSLVSLFPVSLSSQLWLLGGHILGDSYPF